MKYTQKGEITVLAIVMVAMMAWMISRGVGMMGMAHGDGHAEQAAEAAQPKKMQPPASASNESTAPQR
ncbi:MAG: hypothetical protein EPO42_06315 [Gallionellaceae bacterium]|nr:MAG: hypothetical protein EPO42_06315 [Gallionellaceae bacterium]